MALGDSLRRFRRKQRMTLKDLSDKTGLSVSFLSQVELDQSNPSLESLKKIAEALNMSLEVLTPNVNYVSPDDEKEFLRQIKTNPALKETWEQMKDLPLEQQAEISRIIRLWKESNNL